jgi:hypothetical protein
VVKENLPWWVQMDLDRAKKLEHRSRGVLRVHEVGSTSVPRTSTRRSAGISYSSTPSIQGGFSASAGDPYSGGRNDGASPVSFSK